ncbi:MAG: cyclase family protein [Clostridiaceae bacterium]|nr:cyclase family protein [Clostridiaceae bacterium]
MIDLSGPVQNGMWHYEPPFPEFHLQPLGDVPWAGCTVYCEIFEGLNSQTGTYLETPAHYYGPKQSYLVDDVPLEQLFQMRCRILQLADFFTGAAEQSDGVTADMLEQCAGAGQIEPGEAFLVSTGWGRHWLDSCYLEGSPYFSRDAMEWLVARKPFLLGSDMPRWESRRQPGGIFPVFYAANILMLAPCVNLEQAPPSGRLTVLPLRIPGTCCVPCRAVLVEDII